jgi:hypothetical protein
VRIPYESLVTFTTCQPFDESGCLGLQPKLGGRSHLKLNIAGRLIAKKYSDGKVKRTLKRRSKVLENVKRETDRASNMNGQFPFVGIILGDAFVLLFVSKLIKFMVLTFGILAMH